MSMYPEPFGGETPKENTMNSTRKAILSVSLLGSTLVGGAFGAAVLGGTANAQTSTTDTTATAPAQSTPDPANAPPAFDPSKGGHMANGITETLLTGDDAAKATAAANAAVPGGTIQRVETDADGDSYEAHMTKSDGSQVTVKMDASFNVTNIESGPAGHGVPGARP